MNTPLSSSPARCAAPSGFSRRRFIQLSAQGTAVLGCGMALRPRNQPSSPAVLSDTEAPCVSEFKLTPELLQAARDGSLQLEVPCAGRDPLLLPTQLEGSPNQTRARIVWIPKPGADPKNARLRIGTPAPPVMQAHDRDGQIELTESGKPVLRYNYHAVNHPELQSQITAGNLKYAVPRCDYIHPLYGFEGEELTRDWPVDHPHHRGIYWAWPEVEWRGRRGDLHALQHVFARPTGRKSTAGGPVFAQIAAENLWYWEDGTAVVRETALIRAYQRSANGRVLDLTFRFEALEDLVTLARRERTLYGGLNLRFNTIANQQIEKHLSQDSADPTAWGRLAGTAAGGRAPVEILILQHHANPDYPGDWIDYPNLNWLQPTFPRKETRFELRPGAPLLLRYRLVLSSGAITPASRAAACWHAANHPLSPLTTALPAIR